MCELLGMSANVPTDICFSFSGLIQRGGVTGPHTDGWGITFYEGKGCRSFKDPKPSSDSEIAKLVKSYPIKSCSVISHIRQANRGGIALENTHPFTTAVWGQNWTFAHNGQLHGYRKLETGFFRPVGETDSEIAFCWILNQLTSQYQRKPSKMETLFGRIVEMAHELRDMGVFNMLLSNGDYLLAYCSTNLHWITRRAPFKEASLIDADMNVDFKAETSDSDVVTIVATQPLTADEEWDRLQPGQWVLFKAGEVVLRG